MLFVELRQRSLTSLWKDVLYESIQHANELIHFTAIPYSMWGNRKTGEMIVWFRIHN